MKYHSLIVFLLVLACNDIKDCDLDENRNFAVVSFYDKSDGTLRDTLYFNRVISPGYIYEIDSVFGSVALPLDPNGEIMEFELETDTLNYDLTVQYSTIVTIPSVECGPSVKIEDLQWSSSAFDSVALVNPILNYDELINAEIYF